MATLHELLRTLENYLSFSSPTESQKKDLINVLKGKVAVLGALPTHVLNAAIELRTSHSHAANEFVGRLKISLPPAFTKHGADHTRNPYGICHLLSVLWIRAHIMQPSSSAPTIPARSQKPEFFAATTAHFMPRVSESLSEEEHKKIVSELVDRLTQSGFLEQGESSQDFKQITCEKFIGPQVAGIYTIPLVHFAFMIQQIVSNMITNSVQRIAVFISSMTLNHVMAMMISIKDFYVTVRFYDPNSSEGDAKVHFNSADSGAIYFQKINELLDFSQFDVDSTTTDFTLICFHTNPREMKQFVRDFYCYPGLGLHCLITLAGEGDEGAYLRAIRTLVQVHSTHPINLNEGVKDGPTALYMASQLGHINVVKILIDRPGINLKVLCRGSSPLFVSSQNGHDKVVRVLVDRLGKDINDKRAVDGSSALYVASLKGHNKVVQILADSPEINLNVQRHTGETALIIAVQNGYIDVARILILKAATDVNLKFEGFAALTFAIYYGRSEIVTLLLTRSDLIITDYDRTLALQKGIYLPTLYFPDPP